MDYLNYLNLAFDMAKECLSVNIRFKIYGITRLTSVFIFALTSLNPSTSFYIANILLCQVNRRQVIALLMNYTNSDVSVTLYFD